ncbi:MAG: hypothetical protein WBP81_10445 [Solirubrobacteraceae bacterium]
MRSHAGYLGVGIESRELEIDVPVELLEALFASRLRAGWAFRRASKG